MTSLLLVPSALELSHLMAREAQPLPGKLKAYREGDRLWALCGIGPAAAALSSAHLLAEHHPERVLLAGIGGAFPKSGCQVGDVLQASMETFADLGYREGERYKNLDAMKLPMLPLVTGGLGCQFPLLALDPEDKTGPFITVSQITNSAESAAALWGSFNAAVENMEGAAVAAACALYQVPFYQVRAISNLVGPRNPGQWQIELALNNLADWLHDRI